MELFRGMSPFPVSLERYFVDVNRRLHRAIWVSGFGASSLEHWGSAMFAASCELVKLGLHPKGSGIWVRVFRSSFLPRPSPCGLRG